MKKSKMIQEVNSSENGDVPESYNTVSISFYVAFINFSHNSLIM